MSAYWWITFAGGRRGTISAASRDEAFVAAGKKGHVIDAQELPYPADPYLEPIPSPPFCYSPSTCIGRSTCPQHRSCVS